MSSRTPKPSHSSVISAAAGAARRVEGGSRPLPTARGGETPSPDARVPPGPPLRTLARSSKQRRGRGLPGTSCRVGPELREPVRAAPGTAPSSRHRAGPGRRTARVRQSRSAVPRPGSLPPPRPQRLPAAFRLVARGAERRVPAGAPRNPGTRAGPRGPRDAPRQRAAARAGAALGSRAGSLTPPILEKGVCPLRAPARGWKMRFVALGIMPNSPESWAWEGKQPSCRALPLSAGSAPSRASAVASVKWGFRLCSWSPSGPGPDPGPTCWARNVLGLQRSGRPGGRQVGACGHGLGPGGRRPRQGRARGCGAAASRALLPPSWPAWAGPPPGPELAPWGHLRLWAPGPARRAPGCGSGQKRAARCLRRPGEGARSHPAPCPPLPSPLPRGAPATSWAAPGLARASLSR